VRRGGGGDNTYLQYVLYHQWITFGRPPKKEPTRDGKQREPGEQNSNALED
jgi:hypothetical protein